MATKIKLMRLGKRHAPQYRIIVADARNKRDGRAIETIGKYHPKEDPSFIEVDSERAQYWLSVGAQPTDPVLAILKRTGDWQRFKGLPAPEPMLGPAPRADKRAVFEAAAKEAAAEPTAEATTPKKKAARKAARGAEGDQGNQAARQSQAQSADTADRSAEQGSEPATRADASAEK